MTAPPERRTVLLTGGSGVVGQQLLKTLRTDPEFDTICLAHRRPVDPTGISVIPGDITRRHFGMSERDYADLALRVDVVVNSAALVAFNGIPEELHQINVEGVNNIVDFVRRADADLYHVSTAYAHATPDGAVGGSGARYAASKLAGELIVRDSGTRHTIVRPSIIIGDTVSGHTTDFQGFYQITSLLFKNQLPIVPFAPDAPLDMVPVDLVADTILSCVRNRVLGAQLWITNGRDAPTTKQALDVAMDVAGRLGYDIPRPRLIGTRTLEKLRNRMPDADRTDILSRSRSDLDWVLSYFAAYVKSGHVLPSSHSELAEIGVNSHIDSTRLLDLCLTYWADNALPPPALVGASANPLDGDETAPDGESLADASVRP